MVLKPYFSSSGRNFIKYNYVHQYRCCSIACLLSISRLSHSDNCAIVHSQGAARCYNTTTTLCSTLMALPNNISAEDNVTQKTALPAIAYWYKMCTLYCVHLTTTNTFSWQAGSGSQLPYVKQDTRHIEHLPLHMQYSS